MPPLSYTWSVLAEREAARVSLSQMPQPTPKAAFYSVQNALNHPRRNRYSNIMAYDRTAVEADGEYLNANVVCDRYGSWWVASQAPLPGTIYLFLRAMFTRAASTHTTLQVKPPRLPSAKRCILVQLTGIQEGGIKKADPYLPFGSNDKATFPSEHSATQMTLQTTSSTTLPDSGSVITMLDLTSSDDPSDIMQVHHYFFADWPDHGVPQGPAVEKLRALVRDIGRRRAEYECEVWVHCPTPPMPQLNRRGRPRRQGPVNKGAYWLVYQIERKATGRKAAWKQVQVKDVTLEDGTNEPMLYEDEERTEAGFEVPRGRRALTTENRARYSQTQTRPSSPASWLRHTEM
ncbi:hypothetical protein P7C73_g1340, partial [Tremellales sp. Uapishka_1]